MKLIPSLLFAAAVSLTAGITSRVDARPVGYAYNSNGQLFSFDLTNPTAANPIGTPVGTNVRGLDVRPGTTTLYALEVGETTSQLYTVDAATGVRTPVGAGFPNEGVAGDANPYDIDGAVQGIGFNFNPTTLQMDGSIRIRFVTSEGENFRVNSDTGLITNVDGPLAYSDGTAVTSSVAAASYTNSDTSRAGVVLAPTALYYLDSANNNLVISPDANTGAFQNVGSLGADIGTVAAMEFYSSPGNAAAGGGGNFAYIIVTTNGGLTYSLHNVNLSTGAASAAFGNFPSGFEPVGGFTIVEVPEPVTPPGATGFGYNEAGQLFSFPLANPSDVTPIGSATASGIKGIDFRPGSLNLYSFAVGATTSQLGLVNIESGGITLVGGSIPNMDPPVLGTNYSISAATSFGFDFNPTTLQPDGSIRIRMVDSTGTNLRLHSDTGAVAVVDGDLTAGGAPLVGTAGAAYTNNADSRMGVAETPTRLYYLDTTADRLLTSPDANSGTSVVVGSLGADIASVAGFDIVSVNGFNLGYIAVDLGGTGTFTLHPIDLQTGAAGPSLGTFPAGFTPVGGFAVAVIDPVNPMMDVTKPRVIIRNAGLSKMVGENRKGFRLRGVAFDAEGVVTVLVKVGSGKFLPARGTDTWFKGIRLKPGRNIVKVTAVDAAGNRAAIRRAVIRRG